MVSCCCLLCCNWLLLFVSCQFVQSPSAGDRDYTKFLGIGIVTKFLGVEIKTKWKWWLSEFLRSTQRSYTEFSGRRWGIENSRNQGISVKRSRQPRLFAQIFHRKYLLGAPKWDTRLRAFLDTFCMLWSNYCESDTHSATTKFENWRNTISHT